MDLASSITERFLRYVRMNTQSDPSSVTFPSSKAQLRLGELLVKELKEMGVKDVRQDKFGYVIANIPANTDKKIPSVLFCSHLDTSPDCAANDICPVIHKNYQGTDIVLPGDPSRIIHTSDFPELLNKIGQDIITSDGRTLLSADNKAGISELMEVARLLIADPKIRHGKIIFLFVPDEEIGKDTLNLNLHELGADYGYTIDGHDLGSVNNETFCIGNVTLHITGNPMHTGAGNGLMENAVRIASEIIHAVPRSLCSELSNGRDGFIHISSVAGKVSSSKIIFQLRAYTERELHELSNIIRDKAESILKDFPRSAFSFSFETHEKNIIDTLRYYPFVTDFAVEAMKRAGLDPKVEPLRGATTGTGLCAMGLPAANLFTGQHANHSKYEWICIQDMQKAVECILKLVEVWEEKWNDQSH